MISHLRNQLPIVAILLILGWGEYHQTQQLEGFHNSGVVARNAEFALTQQNHQLLMANHRLLMRIAMSEAKGRIGP